MFLINLQGGLGNQMFQYASARGMAKENEFVYLDHRSLEANNKDTNHFTARNYELGIFKNLKARRVTDYQLNVFKSQAIYYKIVRKLLRACILQQRENEYIPANDRPKSGNVYMNGYFQSEKYFKHIRGQLLMEFSFPSIDESAEVVKNQILSAINPVSVHIRRGDYLKSTVIFDVHGVLPLAYYQQAIEVLRLKHQTLSLFIFSDDINWCRNNLEAQGIDIHFIEGNTVANSWKDMALMSLCGHHIIANSSFSWWGAWLSTTNGDVIAPDRWFNPAKVNFDIHDFIPDNWTILNVE